MNENKSTFTIDKKVRNTISEFCKTEKMRVDQFVESNLMKIVDRKLKKGVKI